MCGISGIVGKNAKSENIINSLKRLEYRGYDSAGVSFIGKNNKLHCVKSKGKVQGLLEKLLLEHDPEEDNLCSIGHTRWATHGEPSESNSHPHLSADGSIALVHNGIIENYLPLRNKLEQEGVTFLSETDSEVIVQLLEKHWQEDLLHTVKAVLPLIEGSYGIAVISSREPGTVIASRQGSPLVIGIDKDCHYISSDSLGIIAHTERVIYLEDDDIATLKADSIDITNLNDERLQRPISTLDPDSYDADKGEFPHFMLKEINEQPEALTNTLRGRIDLEDANAKLDGLNLSANDMHALHRLHFFACGTSLNACRVAEYFFENLADMPCDVTQAADFRYRKRVLHGNNFALAISQSGETADTLEAVREAKRRAMPIAGICNTVASSLVRETGRGLYLYAGPEISVASTKAFTSQMAALLLIAIKFGRSRNLDFFFAAEILKALKAVPARIQQQLKSSDEIRKSAALLTECTSCFFIGRDMLFPIALEGALKLKEISYIHAEAYHAAELKHGPIALLAPEVPVIALAHDPHSRGKMLSNIRECQSKGSPVLVIGDENDDEMRATADAFIGIPCANRYTDIFLSSLVLQLLAYHTADLRGCDIDQPRNLAKSVTVE